MNLVKNVDQVETNTFFERVESVDEWQIDMINTTMCKSREKTMIEEEEEDTIFKNNSLPDKALARLLVFLIEQYQESK